MSKSKLSSPCQCARTRDGKRQHALTLSQRQEALNAFRVFDINGDGKISPAELALVLERLSRTETVCVSVSELIRAADVDGDGLVDFEEFVNSSLLWRSPDSSGCAACRPSGKPGEAAAPTAEDGELRRAFELFDRDGNGTICAGELQQAIEMLSGDAMSMEECQRMIARVDANGDGKVDYSEFKHMMAGVLYTQLLLLRMNVAPTAASAAAAVRKALTDTDAGTPTYPNQELLLLLVNAAATSAAAAAAAVRKALTDVRVNASLSHKRVLATLRTHPKWA
ncbi:unnamed protein product [Closterium sp. NIES-54]